MLVFNFPVFNIDDNIIIQVYKSIIRLISEGSFDIEERSNGGSVPFMNTSQCFYYYYMHHFLVKQSKQRCLSVMMGHSEFKR